jgi:Domain of unknown function (DUF4832)
MFPLANLVCVPAVVSLSVLACFVIADERLELEYAPAPVANPLKGLVPYASATNVHFPHAMEFSYVGLSELMLGYDEYDWKPLERVLNPIASRGHQAVFRIFLEYPGKTNVIPKFLLNDGLKVHKYLNTNTQPLPPAKVETPDYEDQNLRRALRNFIAALGKNYDGDPRIGFITAGLLGTWGEWHTYPREELFASKTVQAEVMDAYATAFQVTPVLLRYPAGEKTWGKASNAERPFGYHDDSFAWATLDTGKKSDNWFYMPALKEAGSAAMNKWKAHPIGGEIRPEAWGKVFDKEPGDKNIQSFRECVEQSHASWLMDSGMFQKKLNQERRERAELEVRRMGYEFHVSEIQYSIEDSQLRFQIEIENRGVAPFYYDWKGTFGLIELVATGSRAKLLKTQVATGQLIGILPNEKPSVWRDEIDLKALPKGSYRLAFQVANTLTNGLPLRFANADQDRDLDGWLSLMTIER